MRSGAMMRETDRPKDVREDVRKEAPAFKNDQLFLLILYLSRIHNEGAYTGKPNVVNSSRPIHAMYINGR